MINKRIFQYTNVELLDLIKNGTNETDIQIAEKELDSRSLTNEDLLRIEAEYTNYKALKDKRTTQPLTASEWIPLFFLPFFIPAPRWRKYDHLSESEFDRYEKYGFEEKAKEAKKVRMLGILFWVFIIITAIPLYHFLVK